MCLWKIFHQTVVCVHNSKLSALVLSVVREYTGKCGEPGPFGFNLFILRAKNSTLSLRQSFYSYTFVSVNDQNLISVLLNGNLHYLE